VHVANAALHTPRYSADGNGKTAPFRVLTVPFSTGVETRRSLVDLLGPTYLGRSRHRELLGCRSPIHHADSAIVVVARRVVWIRYTTERNATQL